MKAREQQVRSEITTIINGSTDKSAIGNALQVYMDQLEHFVFPRTENPQENMLDISQLQETYHTRAAGCKPFITDIIREINERAQLLRSPEFLKLRERDESSWKETSPLPDPHFGTLVCVDQGNPTESLVGLGDPIGRTFAGDIAISFSPSHNRFVTQESPIVKRLIHLGRMGQWATEVLIEHSACGRRQQILKNEGGHRDVPSLDNVFQHVHSLSDQFSENPGKGETCLTEIQQLWTRYPREGVSVLAPDQGIWSGIIAKIAQRQALRGDVGKYTVIPTAIELFRKQDGNLFAGLDSPDALTHPIVLEQGGYTDEALNHLVQEGIIFSMAHYMNTIEPVIKKTCSIRKGAKTYEGLQQSWFSSVRDIVTIVENLWQTYQSKKTASNRAVHDMVDAYLAVIHPQIIHDIPSQTYLKPALRRFTHHLFHAGAYAYLFDTLKRGNPPGMHHIEDHLAVSDHDMGTKLHLSLGQGDLEEPTAAEMFTGKTVLHHATPGKNNSPIVVMIEPDTERSGDSPMTTEETRAALYDFREFLNLWPYFVVGDMIPVLCNRGKHEGGISRLGLSVILTFGDIVRLLERHRDQLPDFIYAGNSKGEVVMVPSREILSVGYKTRDEDLGAFRREMEVAADRYSDPAVQKRFT